MKKYYFEKEVLGNGEIAILATAEGYTNEYTPDGEVDTSLEYSVGEEITQKEAERFLNEYGWAICGKCGNIFPDGTDCDKCLPEMYAVSETEYISDCGNWEISTKTGKPELYHLGEPIDMEKVDVPDFVQELFDSLK